MKKLIIAALATATLMSAAHAEGAYVGVGVAAVKQEFAAAGSNDYKVSGKLFGGYEFDKTWGLEAGYTDFPNSTLNYSVGTAAASLKTHGNAFYVAGKGTYALSEQFSLFGKLGATQVKIKSTHGGAASAFGTQSNSETGLYAAVGAQYNLSKQVALTAEYENYGKSRQIGAAPGVFTVAARTSF